MTIALILLVVAFVCFCAAAFGIPSRVSLTDVGLALVTLYLILGRG